MTEYQIPKEQLKEDECAGNVQYGFRSACSQVTAASSVISFIATKTYINLNEWFGLHGTLFIYTAVSFLGFFYIYFYVPETEDRTLQEIMDFFVDSKSARDFKRTSKEKLLTADTYKTS